MYLRSIGRRYNCYGLLLTLCLFLLTVWLEPTQNVGVSIVWILLIVLLIGLFIRQNQILQTARLIWDNRILVVPAAHLDKGSGAVQAVDEKVLSTFGIMSAGYIYEWGCRGLEGVRLRAIEIDQKKMWLSFGNKRNVIQLEFQHGIDTKQNVLEVVEKLWRETGVMATIRGW